MPDMAMCKGSDATRTCPRAATCYRVSATPSTHRQSYFGALPMAADQSCAHYIPHRSLEVL